MHTAHIPSAKSLMAWVHARSSRVLDGLSCCVSVILKYSGTNLDKENIINQNLEGTRACCGGLDPPLATVSETIMICIKNLLKKSPEAPQLRP